MHVQHYAWIIKRRIWLILLGVIICVGATTVITFIKAPVYEASATIEVSAPGTDVFGNQALAVAYALQVTNDDVLQKAAHSLPGVTVAQLNNAVKAFPVNNTQLIDVQADAATPQQAVAIANTVAKVFIQQKRVSETARLQTLADQLSTQLALAKAEVDQTEQRLSQLQRSNASIAQIQQENDLLSIYQSNYDNLLTNYNNIQLQKTLLNGSLSINQLATPPDQPAGTSRGLAIAIAATMSLLLMLLLVLLLDWVDATVKTPEDVAQLAGLEALGGIPWRSHSSIPSPLLAHGTDEHIVEQAFTVINANFRALYSGQRSILVTGLHHRAGTSTVAARLALALAQSGLRVLLVDANLGRPTLHEVFNVVNTRGLSTSLGDAYLLQRQPAQIPAWLQKWTTSVPDLWLLPAGPLSIPSVTILCSLELQKLVHLLLQEPEAGSGLAQQCAPAVDVILFDAPALQEEADAMALALLCDSAVLMVDAAKERKEALKKAEATLQRLGAPILGVVVNRQKAAHRPYLYINQLAQNTTHEEKSAAEPLMKYPVLKPVRGPFKVPSIQPKSVLTFDVLSDGQDQVVTTPRVYKEEAKTNVAGSRYRIPPRPLNLIQPEEEKRQP
ncbi:MAG: Wzz/FepE/Etk N-terminal domain-containing protein [Chloroflexota bacterium]|nr:Wzz/FepE/Etk N-terminal domain-containing protein [Chloroflexota bacterium]